MNLKKEKDKEKENLGKDETQNPQNAAEGASENEQGIPVMMLSVTEVEKLREEAANAGEYLDNWQRSVADFQNYKKLVERDEKNLRANVKIDVIRKYLPVLDDLELALKALPEDSKEKAWLSGIDLIYKKLQKILETEGVTEIAAGEFDPTRHEAITFEKSADHQSGEIIEVVKKGYLLGDRVLRPAQVRVAQ